VRAGLSRDTAYRLEKAIPKLPSATSSATSRPSRPQSHSWICSEKTIRPCSHYSRENAGTRVRNLTAQELKELDF
jgi:hypothetical protein